MTHCQHNQQITQICLTQSCTWREASGCDACLKKYHRHVGKLKIMTKSELIQILSKFQFDKNVKPHSKALQQSMLIYLNEIKNELVNQIQELSKNIANQLCYPFLNKTQYIKTYRKLKNQQIRKVSKKQINQFVNFAQKVNLNQAMATEHTLYHVGADHFMHQIQQFHQAFNQFSDSLPRTSEFKMKFSPKIKNFESNFKKIGQINNARKISQAVDPNSNVLSNLMKNEKKVPEQYNSARLNTNSITNQANIQNESRPKNFHLESSQYHSQPPKENSSSSSSKAYELKRPKQLSIDHKIRNFAHRNSYDDKQKQINEKKLKLLSIINGGKNDQVTTGSNFTSSDYPNPKILSSAEKKYSREENNAERSKANSQYEKDKASMAQSLPIEMVVKSQQNHKRTPSFLYQSNQLQKNQTPRQDNQRQRSINNDIPSIQRTRTPNQDNEKSFEKLNYLINKNPSNQTRDFDEGKRSKTPENKLIESINLNEKSSTHRQNNQNGQKSQEQPFDPQNLFGQLKAVGIDFPELVIKHTLLPEAQQKPKRYDDSPEVKKKTIKVPLQTVTEEFQPSSPLLKRRRNAQKTEKESPKKSKLSLTLKPIEDTGSIAPSFKKNNQDEVKNYIEEKQVEEHDMKSNEAQSLALLMQALPLSPTQAIPLLENALKLSENNFSAAQYLSFLYLDQENPKMCLDLCSDYLERIQFSTQFYELSKHIINNKAAALNMLGRYSESIEILEKRIEFNQNTEASSSLTSSSKGVYSQSMEVLFKNLADAYFGIGIYEKSILNYEQAIKLNPKSDQALYNLSVCLFMQNNYFNSLSFLKRAIQINPRNQNYIELKKDLEQKVQFSKNLVSSFENPHIAY